MYQLLWKATIFLEKQSYRSALLVEVGLVLRQMHWKHLQEAGHGWREKGLAAVNQEKM